jgi:hypothetical protein
MGIKILLCKNKYRFFYKQIPVFLVPPRIRVTVILRMSTLDATHWEPTVDSPLKGGFWGTWRTPNCTPSI